MSCRLTCIIFIFLFSIAGCKQSGEDTADLLDDTENTGLSFKSLDGGEIIGDENLILACRDFGDAGTVCESICISEAFPQHRRVAVNRTYYEGNGQCFIAVMGWIDEEGNSLLNYYEGQYEWDSNAVKGFCRGIDPDQPDFTGYYRTDEVRLQPGQVSPNGRLLYYTMTWFDGDGNLASSFLLDDYQPIWGNSTLHRFSFIDEVLNESVTFELANSATCVKESEITSGLIDSFNF